ncbi:MAG: hypothetical protein KJ944_17390 [Alphaproteobacteria bacterium]|nr:hypothetical protein [Alphaproteobacteria bacterium]MBU1559634.1 hypothetical protein [Alphaproteobacteria bacterium]MBU2304367.1 hypothetical protein [Alphaproteobacteria bacterium]MBU2367152.1 hypothetical protein [Alphaproteobacteria bacterium]
MDFTFRDPRVLRTAKLLHRLSDDLKLIEDGQGPTAAQLSDAPRIDGWTLGYRFDPALVGVVSQHPLLADGPITTSSLYYLDIEAGYARTLSRLYVLGRPR